MLTSWCASRSRIRLSSRHGTLGRAALNSSSNYGDDTFLGAPGTDIATLAEGGGTTSVSGTSASAAEVSAAAALLRAVDPAASNGVIVSRLARNADAAGTAAQTGNGRLNLARALADTSTDSSGTRSTSAGFAGFGTVRNALGSTSSATALPTGDWSASRCGLNPAPMSSMATTTVSVPTVS